MLIQNYISLQKSKEFKGLSESLIRCLANQKDSSNWKFNLYFAHHKDSTKANLNIGLLVTIMSGDTCTYLIGASNDIGRKLQANTVLLWEAILHAKRLGCKWFDIGGLTEETPKGVADFKKGLNAESYKLSGEWYFFPKI